MQSDGPHLGSFTSVFHRQQCNELLEAGVISLLGGLFFSDASVHSTLIGLFCFRLLFLFPIIPLCCIFPLDRYLHGSCQAVTRRRLPRSSEPPFHTTSFPLCCLAYWCRSSRTTQAKPGIVVNFSCDIFELVGVMLVAKSIDGLFKFLLGLV
jgi:hypothetical protein